MLRCGLGFFFLEIAVGCRFFFGFLIGFRFLLDWFVSHLDPVIAKRLATFINRCRSASIFDGRQIHPAFALAKDVVIGQSQEIVAVIDIPFRNHLRKVIAVTPKRMGVQVAFPPASFGLRVGLAPIAGFTVLRKTGTR